jgi:hypothetical protein
VIWVTWQQHRFEALIAAAMLTILALLMLPTGLDMAANLQQSGLAACIDHSNALGACAAIREGFQERYVDLEKYFGITLTALPALVGVFFGAPLIAREVEQGTHRLAWTQSVTRLRWATVKLAAATTVVVLSWTAIVLLTMWWHGPLDQLHGGPFDAFDIEGIAPVSYALFAFGLGVAVGSIIRRTVPAMALTLGLFAGLRLGIEHWLRPEYAPARVITWDTLADKTPAFQGAWVFSTQLMDRFNHVLSDAQIQALFRQAPGGPTAVNQYLHDLGIRHAVFYQPADRFWAFQGIEAALFTVLAVLLLGLALYWVKRRIV